MITKGRSGRLPAPISFRGTTGGAGKQAAVGLSGLRPGTPPVRNMSSALDVVEAGLTALAPDCLRDGSGSSRAIGRTTPRVPGTG